MRKSVSALSILVASSIFGQARNNNWIFGLENWWDVGSPVLTNLSVSPPNQSLYTSCISDPEGGLAFYFTGDQFFGADHSLLNNGEGNDLWSPDWLTQSTSLILPTPGDPEGYYVFMVDRYDFQNAGYLQVRIPQDGSPGEVVSHTVFPYLTPAAPLLAATLNAEQDGYWVVHHEVGTNAFLAYRFTATGLDTVPVISHTGPVINTGVAEDREGVMKFSLDGSLLALSCFDTNYDTTSTNGLFRFNNATGAVTSLVDLPSLISPYGIEFSPSGGRMYWYAVEMLSGQYYWHLWSFSLSSLDPLDITGSAYEVTVISPYAEPSSQGSQMQLAPNGFIYFFGGDGRVFAITQPDEPGDACGLEELVLDPEPADFLWWFPSFCKRYVDSSPSGLQVADATSSSALRLFPNPITSHSTLASNGQAIISVRWSDTSGRLVRYDSPASPTESMTLERGQLGTGPYVLEVLFQNGSKRAVRATIVD